jgi:anthranilate phosphoribosyltransferase
MSSPPSALAAALARLEAGHHLTTRETEAAFAAVMSGEAPPEAIAALLLGLRALGETGPEVAGAVLALRGAMRRVEVREPGRLVDTCGTGGGTIRTLNLSTAAALVVAGAGVPVAKHGNRSFTSRSGSADVLEALGVRVDLPADAAGGVLEEAGIVFLFAPTFHPAMRHVAPVRRELGVATVMNLVGPLANPAGVTRQVVGVAERSQGPLLADALARLGTRDAMVVHALIGLDEIAPTDETVVWRVRNGRVVESRLRPEEHGLATPDLAGLEGGEPRDNARMIAMLLESPQAAPVALRHAVLLNAAAALVVAGVCPDFGAGVERARASLADGEALDRLHALRRATAR